MSKITIFTSGTLGDHLPYFALGQRLQARGHAVQMVVNQAMHRYADLVGLEAVSVTDVARGKEEAQENAWAWNHWHTPQQDAHKHPKFKPQPPDTFHNQVQELCDFSAESDLLLATAIRPHGLAAHLVSDIPWATLSVNPSTFINAPTAADQARKAKSERYEYWNIQLMIDPLLQKLSSKRRMPDWRPGALWAEHVLLGSSPLFYEADPDLLQPFKSVDQSGFWFWEDPRWAAWQPSAELTAFMARRPLVLSFSSQPLEDPADILAKHVAAARQLQMPLLVQSGWAGFSAEMLPDSDDFMLLDYAPHDWLFARARATIQHGGIGSIARAMRQGCPLLIEPFGNDQFFNADRIIALGIGQTVHPFETTADQLADVLKNQVLSDLTVARAQRMRKQMAEEDGIEIACQHIETRLTRKPTSGKKIWWGVHPLSKPFPTAVAWQDQPIPKLIHQTWKTAEVPPQFEAWHQSWRMHHPDWQIVLWDDDTSRQLIADHYAWFLSIYDHYPQNIMRADAARYFIMHHFGGVYVDLDYEAFRPIDALLAGQSLVLTMEPAENVARQHVKQHQQFDQVTCNAFLASAPGHPFWSHLFSHLRNNQNLSDILFATGPLLLTHALADWQGAQPTMVDSALLCPMAADLVWQELPEPVRQLMQRDAYALHHWYGSWWQEPVVSDEPVSATVLHNGKGLTAPTALTGLQLLEFGRTQPTPLISCLMVTRERAALAQLSIRSFLRQSYDNRELIILDDGPDDALANWVAKQNDPRLRMLRLPDRGQKLGELRNLAVAAAKGSYLAQWDDDDLSAPARLATQMAAIQLFNVDSCLLAREMIWLPAGRLLKSTRRFWEGSALVSRRDFPSYPDIGSGEDTPVIEQVVTNSRIVLLDMPELYCYIFHGNNTMTEAHWNNQEEQATTRYVGGHYAEACESYKQFLGVDLIALAAHFQQMALTQSPPRPRQTSMPKIAAAAAESLPTVLVLTPVKDVLAHLPTYLRNLRALDYPRDKLSLAFLEGDSSDGTYEQLQALLPTLRDEFARVELYQQHVGNQFDGPRWEPAIQLKRRSAIAQARNELLTQALQDEQWVLWIDADLHCYDPDVLLQLLAARQQVVVPNCLHHDSAEPFDLNSWRFSAEAKTINWDLHERDGLLQPPQALGRNYLSDFYDQTQIPLDAVGGTMLLVDGDLHRAGLNFPDQPYQRLIDTEALGAMALAMGVQPIGLPQLIIRHS